MLFKVLVIKNFFINLSNSNQVLSFIKKEIFWFFFKNIRAWILNTITTKIINLRLLT